MTEHIRNHRVRRIALRVVVFLLLGAIVNVVVAWGVAVSPSRFAAKGDPLEPMPGYFMRASNPEAELVRESGGLLIWQYPAGSLFEPNAEPNVVSREAFQALIPSWSAFATREPANEDRFVDGSPVVVIKYTEEAAGWPMLSLFMIREDHVIDNDIVEVTTGAFKLPHSFLSGSHPLPCNLIWPGFAINTFLYTAILWLLLATPFTLRRWRRSKRGLCPKCAYPVGASEVCTECGARLVRRSMGLPPPATPAEEHHTQ